MQLTIIQQKIYEARGIKVMLDFDLAEQIKEIRQTTAGHSEQLNQI